MKKILFVLLVITLPMLIGCEKEVLSEGYSEMESVPFQKISSESTSIISEHRLKIWCILLHPIFTFRY